MAKHRSSLFHYGILKWNDLQFYKQETPKREIATDIFAWFVMISLFLSPFINLAIFCYYGHKLFPESIHF